jgi:hypothetical protein
MKVRIRFDAAANFVSRNASTIIALSSLFIAALALWYTVQAKKRDTEYKELSIRPWINIFAEPKELSVQISNEGLGPAVLKQFFFLIGGDCFD